MSASQIAVNSFYSDAAGIYRTLRYTAETIVGITSLTRIAKVNQRWTVFVVMRKGGSVGITGGTDLFFEGFDIIELIINQLPGIFMRTIFQKRFSLRAMGGIVPNDNRSVANIVLYQRDFTVYTINIGETVVGVVVITGTNNALKSVIGMFNLVAIAISNIGDGTVCVILGCNQRLRTYFYRFKPANRIVCKVISNASLTSVAEELGVTAAYLSTVFHREMGSSYSQTLLRIRMENAAKLLSDTHLKVREIVQAVGFPSAKHFTHVFGQYFHCSPVEFRTRKMRMPL